MADPRIEKLAKLLVSYCIDVQPGDKIVVSGSSAALPLVTETYREVVLAGGHPLILWQEEVFSELMLKLGSDAQLEHIAEPRKLIYETYDGLISIRGAKNTRALTGVDPKRQQIASNAARELQEIFMRRSAAGELRWVGTIFPTEAYAQEGDMSLREYEAFVYGACYVDREDPVAEWRRVHGEQQRLIEWLQGKEEVVVKGPNVDLTLSIAGRSFINSDGRHNMPSGEIFTGPVEDSVNGWVRFTYPALYGGREVDGITLRFEDGKVVEATAAKNEAFLLSMLDTDEGARYLGEFAIGTNYGITKFTKSILFDEKIGGTIHMAVGASYPETGGVNKSAIHWDMICDMRDGGQIFVDGELFYENGAFVV